MAKHSKFGKRGKGARPEKPGSGSSKGKAKAKDKAESASTATGDGVQPAVKDDISSPPYGHANVSECQLKRINKRFKGLNCKKFMRSLNLCEKEVHLELNTQELEALNNFKELQAIEEHRHAGVYVARGKNDTVQLLTRNMHPGESVYGEQCFRSDTRGAVLEYRAWSPFRCRLAAAVLVGLDNIYVSSGAHVLYIGADAVRTVSHISDLVGSKGLVYVVLPTDEEGLKEVSKDRRNIVIIVDNALMPYKYHKRIASGSIDLIYCDMPDSDQSRILNLNAYHFMKCRGHFMFTLEPCSKANASKEQAITTKIERMKLKHLESWEYISLEPFLHGSFMVVGEHSKPQSQTSSTSLSATISIVSK